MNWNCTNTEERLSDYLDGALGSAEAVAFSEHATGCASCAQLVAQVIGLVVRMRQIPLVQEPVGLIEKIIAATLGSRKRESASAGRLGWLSTIWQPRFAMGIVTVAASFVIVFHAVAGRTGKVDLNPANLFHVANRQVHLTYARSTKFVNDLRVVYEIQSRLTLPPDFMSPPAPAPRNEPEPKRDPPPSSNPEDPREKSQTIPHHGHRESRAVANLELAFLLTDGADAPENLSDFALRRLL